MAYYNDGDYGWNPYAPGYKPPSPPRPRVMRDDYVYVAIRKDVAERYPTPDDAIAAYLQEKGYVAHKRVPEWPNPHFKTAPQLATQDKYWVNAKREKLLIRDMDLEYVANVLDYLRKYKPELYSYPRSAGGYYDTRPIRTPLARALEQRLEDARLGTDHYRSRYKHYRKSNK